MSYPESFAASFEPGVESGKLSEMWQMLEEWEPGIAAALLDDDNNRLHPRTVQILLDGHEAFWDIAAE